MDKGFNEINHAGLKYNKAQLPIKSTMTPTVVVHCKKEKYDVYIGRPGKWGNPFEIGKDGTRAEVIGKYASYILNSPNLVKALSELQGKRLGCWCAPLPCHGNILAILADNLPYRDCESGALVYKQPLGALRQYLASIGTQLIVPSIFK